MSPTRWRAVLAVSAFWVLAVSAAAGDDAQAIQTTFSQYKAALLNSDGPKAVEVLSAGTIALYDGIVQHALHTPRAELTKLDFISKLMVARIRHEFTREQLSRMTGRELLVIGVNRGWISKSTVADIERLAEIKSNASEAYASIPAGPGVPLFRFLKESGQWKLDLAASFSLGNAAVQHEIKKSGMTEEQYVLRILRALSSKAVGEEVFSPPL